MNQDPHAGQSVLAQGPKPPDARLSVILVHGRGGSAHDMLSLAREIGVSDVAYLAPQALNNTWYPYPFLAPMDQNEPFLSSALRQLERLVDSLAGQGIGRERIALLGFSQGACLALEFAARHAARYAAVVGLSGGLIGPPGTPRDYPGIFDSTQVFLGCSDVDAHIPVQRFVETGEVFRRMGARVDERLYPQMGHTINEDEMEAVRRLLGSGS
jgi:predicted esterase